VSDQRLITVGLRSATFLVSLDASAVFDGTAYLISQIARHRLEQWPVAVGASPAWDAQV
jgi:hypothetical protein